MVSPSKIIKSSNNGLNLGIVGTKKDGLRTNGGSKLKVSSVPHLGRSQLLSNTRFYLDIRNKIQLEKAEGILKAYGAKIEVFFRKDIKVIVTDKPEWMGYGHTQNSSVSPLTTPSPSTNQDQHFLVPKSRTYAMLEKVSQQPASSCSSPLELAQKWRIPILSVRSLRKWIAKIEETYMTELKDKKREKVPERKIEVSARDRAPFIKIESIVSRNLPEFLVLEAWPSLNLDGQLGQCPFHIPSPPSPTHSDDQPQEVKNKLFEVKDKVAVELIQYDTDFRIRDNIKQWECEEGQGENVEVFENRDESNIGHNRNSAINNEDESSKITDSKQRLSPVFNGYSSRGITRQSSQELLKVQCNGLTTGHRNSKLLSPSGSDVLPLPSSRRSTRRASASWCGSTRELSQLSPTDSEIENIRRSDSSFEGHEPTLDSPGITLRPKGQLWLPIALIGTTAEENGNCIRKRFEYSIRQSENAKLSNDFLDSYNEKTMDECGTNEVMQSDVLDNNESEASVNTNASPTENQIKKSCEKKEVCSVMVTRNSRVKNEDVNGRSREGSTDSHLSSDDDLHKNPIECKRRSLSACGRSSPSVKRVRTMSTNSVHCVVRKKKLSPEEKLLQDNKEYFKMEVLNTKLRSTGSLLTANQCKESETTEDTGRPTEKVGKIIIKKIKIRKKRGRRKEMGTKKIDESNTEVVTKNIKVKVNGALRKKRQTELMKLCNEAESFMFGESSRHGNAIAKNSETEVNEGGKRKVCSLHIITKTSLQGQEETAGNSNCENKVKRRRKRRSHAEAFIHDNIDYYKFETPGSRLRYQGNSTDIKSEDKDFIYTLKQRKKDANKKEEISEKLDSIVEVKEEKSEVEKKKNVGQPPEEVEKILFSFESIPITEPWYEVYKRQDEGLENYYPLLSNPNDQPFLLPYELPKTLYSKASTVSEYYKRRRKKLLHLFNHPRKSPRCHASTLAILSSLKKRKRRSGTNISINQMLSDSPPNNVNVPEDKLENQKSEREKKELENEEILDFLYDDESEVEDEEIFLEPYSDSENRPVCTNGKNGEEECKGGKSWSRLKKVAGKGESDQDNSECEEKCFSWQKINPDDFLKDMTIETQKKSGLVVNIANIIENYKNCTSMEDSETCSGSKSNEGKGGQETPGKGGRRRKRKARKINKTGWDNRKSRRRTSNKSEVKESDAKESRIKTKLKVREEGKNYLGSVLVGRKKRTKKRESGSGSEKDDRPVLRSHLDIASGAMSLRRTSQESTVKSDQDYPSYVLRVKKVAEAGGASSNFRLRCAKGRYALQKRRLVLKRKKKRVRDYAWTTQTR